jgi:hypothetical protein
MEPAESLRACVAVALAVVLALVAVLDVWLASVHGPDATVSALVRDYSQRYPVIPLAVGVLIGHLFL